MISSDRSKAVLVILSTLLCVFVVVPDRKAFSRSVLLFHLGFTARHFEPNQSRGTNGLTVY